MKLHELRDKARLTESELARKTYSDREQGLCRNSANAATDQAIAVMMEEFKVMVEGSALIGCSPGPLYSAGWASALESVNQLINALQGEIDHA